MQRPLVFISNDDGVHAKGLKCLIEIVKPLADILVVAPATGQSGMSHAITMDRPLSLNLHQQSEGVHIYSCNGTPVDCVKLGFDSLLKGQRQPDLILSGINHGSNSAINVLYSGTMAAAIEGSFYNIPSIGLSLLNHSPKADFTTPMHFIPQIISRVLGEEIEMPYCINVNIPDLPIAQIKGIKACRQNRGYWREDFEKRLDPHGREYYWLTGMFYNTEEHATDTDEWALKNGYISIVPIQVDLTHYPHLQQMKGWGWE